MHFSPELVDRPSFQRHNCAALRQPHGYFYRADGSQILPAPVLVSRIAYEQLAELISDGRIDPTFEVIIRLDIAMSDLPAEMPYHGPYQFRTKWDVEGILIGGFATADGEHILGEVVKSKKKARWAVNLFVSHGSIGKEEWKRLTAEISRSGLPSTHETDGATDPENLFPEDDEELSGPLFS